MDKKTEFLLRFGNRIEKVIDKKERLFFNVDNSDIQEVVKYLFNEFGCRLSTATGMETFQHVEVLYYFSHDESGQYFCPRVIMTDKEKPTMFSISPIIKGAEWIEREIHDFWGVNFIGHPRLEPLLIKEHPQIAERKNQFRFKRVEHE
ncbi:MAG: NADH-quinone oxidoreductase subunit C [bacterium]